MKTLTCVLTLALLLGGIAGGQTFKKTLPKGLENVDGGTYSFGNWSFQNPNNSRWQFTYKWTQFVHQCPITLTQIAFRPNVDTTLIGGTYINVTIMLSSATAAHNALSSTFANNLDTDATLVFQGDVVIPPYTATGVVPAPFLLTIPFNTGFFEFDPSRLKDLVIDIQTNGATGVGSGFAADGIFPTGVNSQIGHITDPNAASSNWLNYDAGPVVEVCYFLGATTKFDMLALTSGGGQGDLFLQFSNIPAGTVQGYTLISRFPWFGDFGTGPVFGMNPDLTLFTILTLPVGLGDPLHWSYPSGILFPNAPLSLPNGTMTPFVGEMWETAGVAIGPGGVELGHTAPRLLAF